MSRIADVVLYRTRRGEDRAAIVASVDSPTGDGPRRCNLFVLAATAGETSGVVEGVYEGGGIHQWRHRHVEADPNAVPEPEPAPEAPPEGGE